jgi:hypothetical protein
MKIIKQLYMCKQFYYDGGARVASPFSTRWEIPMLNYALIVFAVAAVGGLVLAAHVLRDKFAPWALSLLHALLGAAGLVLLIMMLMQDSAPQKVLIGFVLLLVAALGGFFLASFHLRQKLPPKAVVIVHAGVAVAGFLTLASLAL